MKYDNDEEHDDAEEEPDVDHLDVGCLGEGGGRLIEEGVQHKQRRQAHWQTDLWLGRH